MATGLNLYTWTRADRDSLMRKGAAYLVVRRYTRRADENRGDIVSWHKTYDAAARASRSEYLSIEDIGYITGSDF